MLWRQATSVTLLAPIKARPRACLVGAIQEGFSPQRICSGAGGKPFFDVCTWTRPLLEESANNFMRKLCVSRRAALSSPYPRDALSSGRRLSLSDHQARIPSRDAYALRRRITFPCTLKRAWFVRCMTYRARTFSQRICRATLHGRIPLKNVASLIPRKYHKLNSARCFNNSFESRSRGCSDGNITSHAYCCGRFRALVHGTCHVARPKLTHHNRLFGI